jgi:hypothetical protein
MAMIFLRQVSAVIRRGTEVVLPATAADLPPHPGELNRLHLKGLVSGPARFLLSRWHSRRADRVTA